MNIKEKGNFETRISAIESKLDYLTSKLDSDIQTQNTAPQINVNTPSDLIAESKKTTTIKKPITVGKFLGYAGAGCLILAIILLAQLSINSGWLTPQRELVISALFGMSLIALPFIKKFKDTNYISQLPAVGIVVFHLTVMGAVYFHKLMDPSAGILFISAIGIISLALLYQFEYESYAVISIVGTYFGAIALYSGFQNRLAFVVFLIVWNIIYCMFAIHLKKRAIILLVSYLALGLVAFEVIRVDPSNVGYLKAAGVQAIQFIIFLIAVIIYSVKNKMPLKQNEAWLFFPLVLFFYFIEYNFIGRVGENYATAMAVAFSAILLSLYKYARNRAGEESLDSSEILYTVLATIFAHSIFFSLLDGREQVLTGFLMVIIIALFHKKISGVKRFRGAALIIGLVVGYATLQVFIGEKDLTTNFMIVMGALFALQALVIFSFTGKGIASGRKLSNTFILLLFAHS